MDLEGRKHRVLIVGPKHFGLGLVATHQRKIRDGASFDMLFPRPSQTDPFLSNSATVFDTVQFAQEIISKTLNDTAKLAFALKRPNLEELCKNVFDFFYQHYQYKLDKNGVEQLRRPARAWADRKEGIDCDCFSISVSSVLTNLGVPHYLRIIKINNKDYFQHIYVVVPKRKDSNMNNRADYYVIDPVLDTFNDEAKGITEKKDTKMSIPVQYLNGVEGRNMPRLGEEFEGLEGLNNDNELHGKFKRGLHYHLINTRNHVAKYPAQVAKIYKPQELLGALDEAISAMETGNDAIIERTLQGLSDRDDSFLQPQFQGLSGAMYADDEHLYDILHGDADENMLLGLSGNKTRGHNRAKIQAIARSKKTGFFTKTKNINSHIKNHKALNGLGKKGTIKKLAKSVVKYNPLSVAIRASFLTAMRINFGKIAQFLYWSYFTKQDAIKKGVKPEFWANAVKFRAFVNNIFLNKLQGDEKALKKAVINGRAAKVIARRLKKKGVSGIEEMEGLGVVTLAMVASAMGFLTPIIIQLKKIFRSKNGRVQTETGGEMDISEDPNKAIVVANDDELLGNDDSEMQAAGINGGNPFYALPSFGELGTEFDTFGEASLGCPCEGNELHNDFKRRLSQHYKNTRSYILTNPGAVEKVYQPKAIVGALDMAIAALDSGNDERIERCLQGLSESEETFLQPELQGLGSALHANDDLLYSIFYGALDEEMLEHVEGLGKKGAAGPKIIAKPVSIVKAAPKPAPAVVNKVAAKIAPKQASSAPAAPAKKGIAKKAAAKVASKIAQVKTGPFTKAKNANKEVKKAAHKDKKADKPKKGVLKKVGQKVAKLNPVSIGLRTTFLAALRTNTGKVAQHAYWGYFTQSEAAKAGVTADFWNKSKQVLESISKTFVDKLKGDESALKKAIVNGRAAKMVGKAANKKGVKGLGYVAGLGAEKDAEESGKLIAGLISLINKLFKKKNGKLETENGGETDEIRTDADGILKEMQNEGSSDDTVENDGSADAAEKVNDESSTSDDGDKEGVITPQEMESIKKVVDQTRKDAHDKAIEAGKSEQEANDLAEKAAESKQEYLEIKAKEESGMSTGAKVGLAAGSVLLISGIVAMARKSSQKAKAEKTKPEAKPSPTNIAGLNKKNSTKSTKKTTINLL